MAHRIRPPFLAILLILGACSRTDNEPGPGGVTVSEAKALDDAAAILESRTDPANEPNASEVLPDKNSDN